MDEAFVRCYPLLIAWCRRRIFTPRIDAEDLVHQTYLRCRRSRFAAEHSPRAQLSYFLRALRWTAADALRRARCRPMFALGETGDACGRAPHPLRGLIAQEAIEQLSEREFNVCFRERDLGAITYQARATLATRAKNKLRAYLDVPRVRARPQPVRK